jgi:hypothetical protein
MEARELRTTEAISAALEAARHAAALAKLGLDAGISPDGAPGPVVEQAFELVVRASMAVMSDLLDVFLPRPAGVDHLWVGELYAWVKDALRAATAGEPRPVPPPRPPELPARAELLGGGSPVQRAAGAAGGAVVVDAELVDDDVITEEDERLLDEYRRLTGHDWVDVG